MAKSNQRILTAFFKNLINIVSGDTSDVYAIMVIKKFIESSIPDFSFAKYIYLHPNKISIDKEINSTDPKLVGEFITNLMNSLFSDLFRHLIRKKMSVEVHENLKSLGVKI